MPSPRNLHRDNHRLARVRRVGGDGGGRHLGHGGVQRHRPGHGGGHSRRVCGGDGDGVGASHSGHSRNGSSGGGDGHTRGQRARGHRERRDLVGVRGRKDERLVASHAQSAGIVEVLRSQSRAARGINVAEEPIRAETSGSTLSSVRTSLRRGRSLTQNSSSTGMMIFFKETLK